MLRRRSLLLVRRVLRSVPTFALLCLGANAVWAQVPAPILTSAFPPGGQQGGKFDLTLSGTDIDDVATLHFTHAGIKAAPKMTEGAEPKPVPKVFVVEVAKDVPTGLYEVRGISPYGVSNARAFQIGTLGEVTEIKPKSKLTDANEIPLNSVVSGRAKPEGIDFFKFKAKQGQRILLDCWAQRLDSRMDATLVLFDEAGNEIERSLDVNRRDPFIDFTAPRDGDYVAQLFDFLYTGGPDHFYRLAIHTAPHVDLIAPSAGEPGKKSKFTLYGRNLPGGTPDKTVTINGKVLEKLEIEIELPSDPLVRQRLPVNTLLSARDGFQDAFAYRLSTPSGESNPTNIFFAGGPTTPEQEPENNSPATAQKLTIPCEVVGQFNPKGDQDWFTFDAKKGQVLWIEVISQRMGLTTDPYLLLQKVSKNDKGEQISDVAEVDDPAPDKDGGGNPKSFDTATDDPSYKLTVAEDGTYRVLVKDLYSGTRGSPRAAYRLLIRTETPDFRLVAFSEGQIDEKNAGQMRVGCPVVIKGGAAGLKVQAYRGDGFNGEIEVSVTGLPPEINCPNVVIGPGMNAALLILSAAENAPSWSGPINIVGKAKIKDAEVVREARSAALTWEVKNPQNDLVVSRMTQSIAVAVNAQDESPAVIQLGEGKPLETKMGEKVSIPIKVTRRGEFKGNLKLTAIGLPKELKPADLDIAAGANDGTLTLDVKPTTPAGTYTFFLQGASQINYRKNPKAAEKATEAQKQSDKAATEAAAAAKTAAEQLAAATTALTQADAALKSAADKLKAATDAAVQKADDEGLKTAKDAAEKAHADAQGKQKSAAEAKAGAEKVSVDAIAKQKSADAEKAAAAAKVKDTTEAAKPKSINMVLISTPVTVKVNPK